MQEGTTGMSNAHHGQGAILSGQCWCQAFKFSQDFIAGCQMIKGEIVGCRNNEKSLVGEFFKQISVRNLRGSSHQGPTEEMDNRTWRVIHAARIRSKDPVSI